MSNVDVRTVNGKAAPVKTEDACQCDTGSTESRHVATVLALSLVYSLVAFALLYAAYH